MVVCSIINAADISVEDEHHCQYIFFYIINATEISVWRMNTIASMVVRSIINATEISVEDEQHLQYGCVFDYKCRGDIRGG